MGKGRKFKAGQVVWVASVPDRNGVVKPQRRPLLVIWPEPVNQQSLLCCLAISTAPENDLDDPSIEMPWNSKTGDTTGIYKQCRVVLHWHVIVEQKSVEKTSGFVLPSFLERVVSERERTLPWQK